MSQRTCKDLGVCQGRKEWCYDCPNHTYVGWKCAKCGAIVTTVLHAERSHDCEPKEQP